MPRFVLACRANERDRRPPVLKFSTAACWRPPLCMRGYRGNETGPEAYATGAGSESVEPLAQWCFFLHFFFAAEAERCFFFFLHFLPGAVPLVGEA